MLEVDGLTQGPGDHHLTGPEVDLPHRLHPEEGPAKVVLPASTEEVQPASGAASSTLQKSNLS